MFDRLKAVFSSMAAMRIGPAQKDLQKKLHLITQYLINSPKQFDAWMELQTQNHLHAVIAEIYTAGGQEGSRYTQEDICFIYQFYTLLLINCQDELLVCKLVSDDLIIKMCKMDGIDDSKAFEVEPYRINLIKAYLGNAAHEAIKYMVIQDQFKVFLECVELYKGKAGTVEQTTIANSILNIIKKVDDLPFLWESIWVEKGLKALFLHCIIKIQEQLADLHPEDLQETILFLVEVGVSITKHQYKKQLTQFCRDPLSQILKILKEIDINLRIRDTCLLLGLFTKYGLEEQIVNQCLSNWLDDVLYQLVQYCEREEPIDDLNLMAAFVVNKIVTSQFSHLADREYEGLQDISGRRKHIMSILFKVLQSNIKIAECSIPTGLSAVYMGYIKQLLQTIFNLKIVLYPKEQWSELSALMLEFFEAHTVHYKKLLQKEEDWDSIIHWYQEGMGKATKQILQVQEVFEHIKENTLNATLLTFEYIRNFRYMIADTTSLDPKSIKQQKFHHTTFSSVGMAYQPNTVVQAGLLSVVTPCIVHHNYHQIPSVIAEDRECFIVAFKVVEDEYKILINIKFTDIENFVYGDSKSSETKGDSELPKYVRVNLRGSQQIIFQFANPQISGVRFKEYLIKSKNNSRERQLTFLKSWVNIYQNDTLKSLQLLKQSLKQHEDEDQRGL